MEKKTIWHTPDEIPTAYKSIGFCTPFCEALCGYYEPASDDLVDAVTNTYYHRKVVSKWAYIDDLIATSKALDVARDMYIKLAGERGLWTYPSENDAKALERNQTIFENLARKEFDKAISEIIGGK